MAPSVTDKFSNEVYRLKEEYGVYNEDTDEGRPSGMSLAWVLCPFPTPQSLAEVSFDDVLQFRAQHQSERRAFRQAIYDLGDSIANSPSAEAIRDVLEDRRSEIEEHLNEQRETLH